MNRNEILDKVTAHLNAASYKRIKIIVPGARSNLVLSHEDLSELKAEGSGLRFRELFIFATQIRFGRVA